MATNEKKKQNPNIADATPGMTGNQASTTPTVEPEAYPTNPAGSGYGSQYDQAQGSMAWEEPMMAVREWMRRQGIDPNANNPLVQRMFQRAAAAPGLYDLSTNLQGNPATGFLDFMNDFMSNWTTAGAAPMFSKAQIDEMVQKAVHQAMTHGDDSGWAERLGNATEVSAQTGQPFASTPKEMSDALKSFLGSAYHGVVNPYALEAMVEGVDRDIVDWRDQEYRPGGLNVGSFLPWLLSNGGIPGQPGQ